MVSRLSFVQRGEKAISRPTKVQSTQQAQSGLQRAID